MLRELVRVGIGLKQKNEGIAFWLRKPRNHHLKEMVFRDLEMMPTNDELCSFIDFTANDSDGDSSKKQRKDLRYTAHTQ